MSKFCLYPGRDCKTLDSQSQTVSGQPRKKLSNLFGECESKSELIITLINRKLHKLPSHKSGSHNKVSNYLQPANILIEN